VKNQGGGGRYGKKAPDRNERKRDPAEGGDSTLNKG